MEIEHGGEKNLLNFSPESLSKRIEAGKKPNELHLKKTFRQ
jgi:hypothetical protein